MKRSQDDDSDSGTEEGEVRVGALGGEGGAVWAVGAVRDGGRHRCFFVVVVAVVLLLCCCCVLLLCVAV